MDLPIARDLPLDRIERWPLERLIPYAKNARTHSEAQIEAIAASIREFGWTIPVLADEGGGVIAGHGRILAAKRLGMAEAPVMVAAGWSARQKRAYVLADNKLAERAGWDMSLLKLELADLAEMGADLEVIGFDAQELTALLAPPQEAKAPEDFSGYDEDIETAHRCPSCGYKWSGKSGAE